VGFDISIGIVENSGVYGIFCVRKDLSNIIFREIVFQFPALEDLDHTDQFPRDLAHDFTGDTLEGAGGGRDISVNDGVNPVAEVGVILGLEMLDGEKTTEGDECEQELPPAIRGAFFSPDAENFVISGPFDENKGIAGEIIASADAKLRKDLLGVAGNG